MFVLSGSMRLSWTYIPHPGDRQRLPVDYTRLESHLEPRGRRVRGQILDGKGVEERGYLRLHDGN